MSQTKGRRPYSTSLSKRHHSSAAHRPSIEPLESRCLLTYAVIDLGHLGGGDTLAWGINNKGEVVGNSRNASGIDRAFIYRNNKMTDLGTLGGSSSVAYAINNHSQVTGRAFLPGDQDEHAFFWDGAMQDIPTLGGSDGAGTGINDDGIIVGQSDLPNGSYHAFMYDPPNPIQDLGTLGSGDRSAARGINSLGQITGGSFTGGAQQHAFLWEDGQMNGIGTFGGVISKAYGINNSTIIVGTSQYPGGGFTHAYRWKVDWVPQMQDLGTFGGMNSVARAINSFGAIVGDAEYANGTSRAFIYQNDTMIDLNTLIPAESPWVLETAYGINDRGQIIGWGTRNGETGHSFLLTRRQMRPTPPGTGTPIPPAPFGVVQPDVANRDVPPRVERPSNRVDETLGTSMQQPGASDVQSFRASPARQLELNNVGDSLFTMFIAPFVQ